MSSIKHQWIPDENFRERRAAQELMASLLFSTQLTLLLGAWLLHAKIPECSQAGFTTQQ